MKDPRFEAQMRVPSPLGPLTLAATARGLALVWFDDQAHRSAAVDAPVDENHPHLALAARELAAYWQAPQQHFTVPLDPQGTPFQQAVWQVLRGIVPGRLSSYGEVARAVGRPSAARAVGAAIGRNPLGIVVPCHRVVGVGGALTGYAGGLQRKKALLRLEGVPT
jgi:methylated-DNA-[protein]-cysteine S-methyltransferase